MKIFNPPFTQVTVPEMENSQPKNALKIEKLLDLITNKEFKSAIVKHYNLNSIDSYINIGNIDIAYDYVRYICNKYEYLLYNTSNKKVNVIFEDNEDGLDKTDAYFIFNELVDDDGEIFQHIKAKAIYNSLSDYYEDRELSKYINFLKSKSNNLIPNTNEKNFLISDINNSWEKFYNRNNESNKERKYRFLKEDNNYYLRSITSGMYKEYGVAFCFVVSMLAIHKLQEQHKGLNHSISFLSLNESKIDMIITNNQPRFIESIDRNIKTSLLIRNSDLGDRSLSFTHTLKVSPINQSKNNIYLFPKMEDGVIKNKLYVTHRSKPTSVLKLFDNLSDITNSTNEFIDDFKNFNKAKTPDELRAKIEERIRSNNSPFKSIKSLKDLFSRNTTKQINNLADLLYICEASELIDMDYDLRFKLRYIISDVLLYGKSS